MDTWEERVQLYRWVQCLTNLSRRLLKYLWLETQVKQTNKKKWRSHMIKIINWSRRTNLHLQFWIKQVTTILWKPQLIYLKIPLQGISTSLVSATPRLLSNLDQYCRWMGKAISNNRFSQLKGAHHRNWIMRINRKREKLIMIFNRIMEYKLKMSKIQRWKMTIRKSNKSKLRTNKLISK